MAGAHTSEKRWLDISTLAQQITTGMISALTTAEAAYAELQDLYGYVGSTIQGLADQLFVDDWSVRSTPGVNAVITVDVVAGVVGNPLVAVAGTAYSDGTGYTLNILQTAGGGNKAATVTYDVVAGSVTNPTVVIGGSSYNDGTSIPLVELPGAGLVFDTAANVGEVEKAQDLFDAVTALHELHQAANNVIVVQEDRYAQLRRMS